MKTRTIAPILLMILTAPLSAQPSVPARFEPLAAIVGRTWRGEFENSTKDAPVVDIARWELALAGTVVRVLHSINDGVYGGETIIRWDEGRGALVYDYFSTAGFHTSGTMRVAGDTIHTRETVEGNANGITEVTSYYTVTADGAMVTQSSYLKNGEWVGGRAVRYVEAPEAKVVLP